MVVLKSAREIELMRRAGALTAAALDLAGGMVEPGVTTKAIDTAVRKFIMSHGATPSFLHYNGYPASCCISVNDKVIHGIPSAQTVLREGDIVSIDVGACLNGYHGDCADTFPCGAIAPQAQRLIDVTRASFFAGFALAKEGFRLGDLGGAIQKYAEEYGYGVVYEYTGHGVGRSLHEDPSVPNLGPAGHGMRLRRGMTIAVEPMINEGVADIRMLDDGWTIVTSDGKLSAHYENTILITDGEPEILTPHGDPA